MAGVNELVVHPAAEAFPMLPDDEVNALAIDIVQNGLLEPIVLAADGSVLDGRNRLAACRLVNVDPEFVRYDGDPWAYSRSANLWRRNMTTGQRAAACAISLIAEGKRKNGRWVRGSVPEDGIGESPNISSTWQSAMKQAGTIADWSDEKGDLLISVRDGHVALDAAYQTSKARKEKHEWEEEQKRKAKEREIAASDAELVRWIEVAHASLQVDEQLVDKAQDLDNWKALSSLADRMIKQWNQAKEKARVRLPE